MVHHFMRDQHVHISKMTAFFYTAWLAMEINHHFLINKHGDLYLLFQDFGTLIILFVLKNLKEIFSDRKKDVAESVHKIVS